MFRDISLNLPFVGGSVTVLGAVYIFGNSQPVKVVTKHDLLLMDEQEEDPKEFFSPKSRV